jgi:hypothetical protein
VLLNDGGWDCDVMTYQKGTNDLHAIRPFAVRPAMR